MPRNIDPAVAEVKGACLVTVDDLDRVVQDNIQKRLSAAGEVERIVMNKVQEFYEVINKIHLLETKRPLSLSSPVISILLTAFIFWALPVHAGMVQIKAYKEAYPDAKPKCIDCHVDKMPKKDDGAHELNDYGKAVVKAAGTDKPTADTYKKAGPIPSAS